jgi:hypothetical protein
VSSEVLFAVTVKVTVIWDLMPCSTDIYKHFRGACCLLRGPSTLIILVYHVAQTLFPEDSNLTIELIFTQLH